MIENFLFSDVNIFVPINSAEHKQPAENNRYNSEDYPEQQITRIAYFIGLKIEKEVSRYSGCN